MRVSAVRRTLLLLATGALTACGSPPSNSPAPNSGCSRIRISAAPFFEAGPTAFGTPPNQLTATVTGATGGPLADVTIDFSVAGHRIGTALTNAGGIAQSDPDGVSIGSELWMAVHPADAHCAATAVAPYTKEP